MSDCGARGIVKIGVVTRLTNGDDLDKSPIHCCVERAPLGRTGPTSLLGETNAFSSNNYSKQESSKRHKPDRLKGQHLYLPRNSMRMLYPFIFVFSLSPYNGQRHRGWKSDAYASGTNSVKTTQSPSNPPCCPSIWCRTLIGRGASKGVTTVLGRNSA
jgi:hypothetical protein